MNTIFGFLLLFLFILFLIRASNKALGLIQYWYVGYIGITQQCHVSNIIDSLVHGNNVIGDLINLLRFGSRHNLSFILCCKVGYMHHFYVSLL